MSAGYPIVAASGILVKCGTPTQTWGLIGESQMLKVRVGVASHYQGRKRWFPVSETRSLMLLERATTEMKSALIMI